ncbi:MAG: phage holin family protein [Bacteroides sp.]|nr:phage holin family protein [Bacteroides sp.]MCM1456243.1 phage holin family protein [Lachnoclostridium sp.]
MSEKGSVKNLYEVGKRMLTLYIDNARLSAAEKITVLFSAVALYSIVLVLAMVMMVFVSMGIATMLAEYNAPFWSYFIVAGVFLAVIVLLFVFKTPLLLNPIARFISSLLVSPPKTDEADERQ